MRRLRLLAPLLALIQILAAPVAAPAQTRELLNYPSIEQPVVGDRGMAVSQNEAASRVGAEVLARGGNAVDAAVAMSFVMAVTLPRAGNIGGDGFMLVWLPDRKKALVVDFRSVAPQAAKLDLYLDKDGKESNRASRGWIAPGVPGTVAGLWLAHQRWGKRPWKELLQPAIDMADKGYVLSHDEAFALQWGRERLTASDTARKTFVKAGGSWQGGERLRQPELAWSLRLIADQGADAFYKGEIARRIDADMKAHGGLITLADLAAYRPMVREPLVGSYRGHTVITVPPASSGGATLLQMLNMLEAFDLKAMKGGSAESLHVMSEVMKLSYADRIRFLGDTDFVKTPLTGFTSKAYAAERVKKVRRDRAMPVKEMGAGDPWAFESKETTHLSVADRDGGAVSLTYTLGSDFGSGVAIEGAGFLLNNQMNNFAHEAALKAARDGKPLPPNAMQPGKRMLSSMTPTMVLKDGRPWLVTGSPGGSTIIEVVLQMLVNLIDFDLNVAQATHLPRIYQGWTDELGLEPGFNPDTAALLKAKGHEIEPHETMGSTQSIVIENGRFYGAADPRRPGATAATP
jgi:gamma-glutamyltranspeptidase/glutathione hydrolase